MAPKLALSSESTLTDRYQTTVPETIRKALGLNKRDKIRYTIQSDGQITLSRAELKEDPIVEQFLSFLAQDMEHNPHHLKAVDADLFYRVQDLVGDIEIDLEAPLSEEDE